MPDYWLLLRIWITFLLNETIGKGIEHHVVNIRERKREREKEKEKERKRERLRKREEE